MKTRSQVSGFFHGAVEILTSLRIHIARALAGLIAWLARAFFDLRQIWQDAAERFVGRRRLAVGQFQRRELPNLGSFLCIQLHRVAVPCLLLCGLVSATAETFETASMFSLPVHPNSVAVGDFNRDGIPDLALPSWSPNQVSILLGDGSGNLSAPALYATGTGPRFAIVDDFNADGCDDIATSNETSGDISVLFGNGAGGVAQSARTTVGTHPYHLASADLNGNGSKDIVVANSGSNTVSVLLNDGAGNFPVRLTYAAGTTPRSVKIADFNADGFADLAVANFGSNDVWLMHGDGAGGFGAATAYPVGTNPFTMAVGDFDRNGRLDLAVPNFGSGNVTVLLGNVAGGFAPGIAYAVATSPRAVIAEDFDDDGFIDLAVANRDSNTVSLLRGNGNGAFTRVRDVGVGSGPFGLAARDMDSDGLLDLLSADRDGHTLSILKGTAGLNFTAPEAFAVGDNPRGAAAADFNADGYQDLVVANNKTNNVSVLLGTADGRFGSPATYAVAQGPYGPGVGDVNNDGKIDIIVPNSSNNSVSVLRGAGAGTFATQQKWSVGSGPRAVVLADLDGNGWIDIAAANYTAGSVSVLLGTGNGSFAAQKVFAAGGGPTGIQAADFNHDGKLDLAVSNGTSNNVGILLGAGVGNFGAASFYPAGAAPAAVAAADVDGDGHADLAVANENSNDVTVLRGDGTGAFSAAPTLPTGTRPLAVALAEVTGDGGIDLIVAAAGANTVAIHPGVGNGSFQAGFTLPAGVFPRGLALADFNGDNELDIVSVNANSNAVWLARKRASGTADLGVTITNQVDSVQAGTSTTYLVTVTNFGPSTVSSLVLDFNPSAAFTNLDVEASEGLYNAVSGVWSGLQLSGGESVTLSVAGTVSASASGTLSLSVSATPPLAFADPVAANNSAVDSDSITPAPPQNQPPVPSAQSVVVAEDGSIPVTLSAVDPEGAPVAFGVQTLPQHGTLTGIAPNLTYTPAPNYFGPDSFVFTASDGALSASGTITIGVTGVDDAPSASSQAVITNEDVPIALTLMGSDPDGQALTYTIASAPVHGTLEGSLPNLTYRPDLNFSGADSFTFTVTDGTTVTAPATVAIQIPSVNDAPTVVVATADQSIVGTDTSRTIDLTGSFDDVETGSGSLQLSVSSGDTSLVSPVLTGTSLELQLAPDRSGSTTVTVRAVDPAGAWVEDSFLVTVSRGGLRVSVSDANRGEGNSVGPVFTISLSAPATQTVTVTYATADLTAISGVDYIAASGTITFAPGVVSRTVSVRPISDLLDEENETFKLVLTSVTGAMLDDAEGIGTILDDDSAALSVPDLSVTEGDAGTSIATFTVSLSAPSEHDVQVAYATSNVASGAIAGRDYVATSGTLTFPAGTNAPQTVSVTLLNDVLDENNETFSFTLSDALNAGISRAVARATIVDNDVPPTVSISDVAILEGNAGTTPIVFTVTLSAPSELRTRVRYATADGTAIAGSDYTAASGELVFEAGVTSRTVTVLVTGDLLSEGNENFFVNLHTPTSLTIGDGQGVGSILSDE